MSKSILSLLFLSALLIHQLPVAYADQGTTDDFEQWDKDLNSSWDELEKVNNEIAEPTMLPATSVASSNNSYEKPAKPTYNAPKKMTSPDPEPKPLAFEAESIDSRQVSDMKARIDRLEGRVKQLERSERSLEDQIRNLDRTVNDLRRKV